MCRSPHLSTQMKQLKNQLGCPSFEWTGRILTLTTLTLTTRYHSRTTQSSKIGVWRPRVDRGIAAPWCGCV